MRRHRPVSFVVALTALGASLLCANAARAQIVSNPLESSRSFLLSVLDRGQTPVASVNVAPTQFGDYRLVVDPYNPMRSVPWRYQTERDTFEATMLCPVSGHCGRNNRVTWAKGNVSTVTFNGAVVGTATHQSQDVVAIALKQPLKLGPNILEFSQKDPRTGRGTTKGGFVPGRSFIIERVAPGTLAARGAPNSALRVAPARLVRGGPRGAIR